MRNKTKFKRIVARVTREHKKKMDEMLALPIFTLFLTPADTKDKKDEQMKFGYMLSGEKHVDMNTVYLNLKGIVDEMERSLFK